ncbi:MAG: PKD domain-containing protein, partial [Chloroflexi bacterium]|nr:PKD domain-containing protein [Chloroflexota bacterium]
NTLIPGNWLGSPHRFRIQRTAAQAIFAIDGAIVATHNFAYGDLISPIVSDAAADSLSLALDWLTITPYAASGSFTSRVFDAGAAMDWSTVTWDASGTSVSISARSGNTPAPDGSWSAFTPVTASGASLGLSGRYLQYQLALSTADTAASPLLNAIGFACGQSANLPPVITASQTSLVINEGQTASNSGTVSDPNGSAVTLSASLGTVTNLGNGTWSWSYNASDNLAATVTITATDPQGAQSQVAFNLSVNNVAPSATFTNLSGVIQAGQSATLAFTNATDPGSQDTAAGFLYSYDCTNSGTFVLTDSTSSTFNCPYPTSGVFTARGRIADKDGGSTIYTVEVTVQDAPVTPPTGTPTATPTQTPTSTPTPTPTSTPPASTPQTVTFQINSGVNDVNEDGTSFNNSNSTIWIGNAASATASYAGLRFTNVTIPAGATINSAFLQVYSTQSQWITINLRLAADASDNSAAFSANSRPSQRPLTNQRVAHASNVLWNANTWYNLDDMSPVIQEVVSRPGWQSGNSLSVIIQGTSAGSWARKFFRSFNGGATTAPRLIVTFTTSGGTQGAPAVVLPEDGITPTPVVLPTLVPTSTLAPTETPFVVTPTAVPTETATLPPTETPAPPTDIPPTATPPVEASPIPLPTASFTASGDTGAAPFTVQFFNQSGGDISAYSWNFGDGGTSADANPVYTFNLPGSYVVTLTVTGPGGTASTAMTITVTG